MSPQLRGPFSLVTMVALAALVGACTGPAAPPSMGSGMRPGTQTGSLPFADTGSRLGTEPGAQVISFKVVGAANGAVGPDGRRHDTVSSTSATTVVVGRPVTVEIENQDDLPHSFTIPELGIDRLIPAANHGNPGKVTFTFTPRRPGPYRWFCALPCDLDNGGWAMGRYGAGSMGMGRMGGGMMEPGVEGFMAGYVSVTSG